MDKLKIGNVLFRVVKRDGVFCIKEIYNDNARFSISHFGNYSNLEEAQNAVYDIFIGKCSI